MMRAVPAFGPITASLPNRRGIKRQRIAGVFEQDHAVRARLSDQCTVLRSIFRNLYYGLSPLSDSHAINQADESFGGIRDRRAVHFA